MEDICLFMYSISNKNLRRVTKSLFFECCVYFPTKTAFFIQVRMIEFVAFNNGIDPELNPSTVHIFVNRENLGFEDCDDVDPTQTLDLTTDETTMNTPIQLKFVKYQRVKSLTLFISDNNGGDITALGGIKIYGFPVDTVNMNDFKKQQEM